MYYKTDWEQAKKRLYAFWNNEIIDRCCVGVLAPRKSSKLPAFPELQNGAWLGGLEKFADNDYESFQKWWTDPEENYKRMELWFENTYFGGEAAPITYINWGAMALASFYGSKAVFNKTSVWYPEVIDNWDTWDWNFDEKTNVYWNQIVAITEYLLRQNNGRYFVGIAEMGHAADVLTLMRGMDKLSLDLYDCPDKVKEAIKVLSDSETILHKKLFNMTKETNDNGGVLAWMNLWAPDRLHQMFCDYSSVLSPAMFKEFFVPEIYKVCDPLNYTSYHLDGPDAMRNHLDTLLEIDSIKNIQWTPGAGLPPTYSPQYIPQYKKVQTKGKSLYLLAKIHEIEPLLAELSPKGLYLCTQAESEDQANELLRKVEKWSKRK